MRRWCRAARPRRRRLPQWPERVGRRRPRWHQRCPASVQAQAGAGAGAPCPASEKQGRQAPAAPAAEGCRPLPGARRLRERRVRQRRSCPAGLYRRPPRVRFRPGRRWRRRRARGRRSGQPRLRPQPLRPRPVRHLPPPPFHRARRVPRRRLRRCPCRCPVRTRLRQPRAPLPLRTRPGQGRLSPPARGRLRRLERAWRARRARRVRRVQVHRVRHARRMRREPLRPARPQPPLDAHRWARPQVLRRSGVQSTRSSLRILT